MKQITTLLFLFTSFNLFADGCQWKEYRYITSFNGLSVRAKKDKNSEKLGTVPYWEKVLICGFHYPEPKYDTINGVVGKWEQIRYNGLEGFVFDAYLVEVLIDEKDDPNYRLLMEHQGCGGNNYNPNLNWYGIYEENGNCFIKSVNVNQEKRSNDMFVPVYTDLPQKSMFLFATKDELNEGYVGGNNIKEHQLNHSSNFLYPGQYTNIWYSKMNSGRSSNTMNLYAVGSVKSVGYCPEFENYELRISPFNEREDYQNLTPYFSQLGECQMVELYWFGDLNSDEIADPMFISSYNHGSHYTLFLSTNKPDKPFVRVASNFMGGCY